MTGRERRALRRYLRRAADAMALRDWTVELLDEPAEEGNDATIHTVYGRKLARLQVCADFRQLSPEEQRDTIAHELVHCHLEPPCAQVRSDIEDLLGKPADRVFWRAFLRNMEYAVDGLAAAVAPALPLIDWPAP